MRRVILRIAQPHATSLEMTDDLVDRGYIGHIYGIEVRSHIKIEKSQIDGQRRDQ